MHTLTALRLTFAVSAALMIWAAIKMYADVTMLAFAVTGFLAWLMWLYQDAIANDAAVLKVMDRFGYLTCYDVTTLTLHSVYPCDVLTTLNRLEARGVLVSRNDKNFGKMWRKA